ncbi:hypothetical protein DBB29_02945 [Pandoraea cepalis]|uniref:HEPN AbiU2-like domain-containing protein n=2 Tax=Pandoraea cepalis TaxID=2508294 RepID=A0AAW7MIS8_9BURK|nr:hypothetical protein [Pandoraea cepalis]MDN4577077.1 hypothetical protein [Pandoraea cepalis]
MFNIAPRQSAIDLNDLSGLLVASLRSIAYFHAMASTAVPHYKMERWRMTADPMEHFWATAIYNASMMAVIDWCKVFGSTNSNHTHWRNVFPASMRQSVRGDLESIAGGKDRWVAYQDLLVTFRDKRAAHHDTNLDALDQLMETPPLELAVDTAIYLRSRIHDAIGIDNGMAEGWISVSVIKEMHDAERKYFRDLEAETTPGLGKAIAANPPTVYKKPIRRVSRKRTLAKHRSPQAHTDRNASPPRRSTR